MAVACDHDEDAIRGAFATDPELGEIQAMQEMGRCPFCALEESDTSALTPVTELHLD